MYLFRALIPRNGAEGDRTPDLCSAIAALSQLSYSPDLGACKPSPDQRFQQVDVQSP